MKLKLAQTLLFLCFLLSVSAQKTIELNKQWNVVDYKVFSPNICTNIYSFRNDTIINTIEYLQLFVKRDSTFSTNWESLNIFMREDSINRIFILDNGIDKILYDFNLIQHDTFQLSYGFLDCELLVHQVDSILLLNGQMRKRIRLIRSDDPDPNHPWYGYKDWIQGIGSSTSLYGYIESCFTDYPFDLLCYFEDGELVYSNPNNQGCYLTPVKELNQSELISIYPNPTQNEIKLISNIEIYQIDILTLNGNTIISSEQPRIDISHLNSGIYIVRIYTRQGIQTQRIVVQ